MKNLVLILSVISILAMICLAETAQITFDEIMIPRNGEGLIPIKITSEEPIAGIQFTLTFNPEQVNILEPRLSNQNQDFEIRSHIAEGTLKTILFSFSGETLPGDGSTIVEIPVRPATNFTGTLDLELEQFILANKKGDSIPIEKSTLNVKVTENIPAEYKLKRNYPNPFNPTTTIEYHLPEAGDVVLKIYNLLGQEVRTLVNTHQPAGIYRIVWDGKDNQGNQVASGEYIYNLKAGTYSRTFKMVLLK